MLKSIIVVTSIFVYKYIHSTWNLGFMIVSLIIIFYIYQYFNILDFGLLNELCERGMLSFDLNKNCEQL